MKNLLSLIIILLAGLLFGLPVEAIDGIEHVFIFSFDGGKPEVMKASSMPHLFALAKEGAATWQARTIFPSLTLPSHTSMLTGVGPDKHKMLWNDWEPQNGMVKVPTIFQLAHQHKLKTAMFVSKPKFIHLFLPGSCDNFSLPSYEAKVTAGVAASYIKNKKPNLCFIHFADSDSAGHTFGWGSNEQKKSLADEDDALEQIMEAIKSAGIEKTSVVILTADHGGHAKTHGSNKPEDMEIPWIVWGDTVKHGYSITAPVNTCDTAATALWLLDVPIPSDFDGKPVSSAFENSSTK